MPASDGLSPTSPPHLSKANFGTEGGAVASGGKIHWAGSPKNDFFTLPCQRSFFPSKPPPLFTQQSKTTTPRDQPRDLIVLGIY
jgi:hypothetical protein